MSASSPVVVLRDVAMLRAILDRIEKHYADVFELGYVARKGDDGGYRAKGDVNRPTEQVAIGGSYSKARSGADRAARLLVQALSAMNGADVALARVMAGDDVVVDLPDERAVGRQERAIARRKSA